MSWFEATPRSGSEKWKKKFSSSALGCHLAIWGVSNNPWWGESLSAAPCSSVAYTHSAPAHYIWVMRDVQTFPEGGRTPFEGAEFSAKSSGWHSCAEAATTTTAAIETVTTTALLKTLVVRIVSESMCVYRADTINTNRGTGVVVGGGRALLLQLQLECIVRPRKRSGSPPGRANPSGSLHHQHHHYHCRR